MRRIVCLGDSLTSGHGIGTASAYPALLHQRVRRAGFPYEVVNAGVSRDTTAHARARLDRALEGDVRVLVVAIGVNDGLRGVPIAQITDNLSHIIETAQKRGIAVLLCGMETHICVMQTALAALNKGYLVHVASDAVGSRSEWNWKIGLQRMRDAGAVISSTEMMMYELLRGSGTPAFKQLLPYLKG